MINVETKAKEEANVNIAIYKFGGAFFGYLGGLNGEIFNKKDAMTVSYTDSNSIDPVIESVVSNLNAQNMCGSKNPLLTNFPNGFIAMTFPTKNSPVAHHNKYTVFLRNNKFEYKKTK